MCDSYRLIFKKVIPTNFYSVISLEKEVNFDSKILMSKTKSFKKKILRDYLIFRKSMKKVFGKEVVGKINQSES